MKVKILVPVSAAIDGSHPGFNVDDEVDLDEKLAKSLVQNGLAVSPKKLAVKVIDPPVDEIKLPVKGKKVA